MTKTIITADELRNSDNYYVHHTASRIGYISRKLDGIVETYKGRFGEGYVLLEPRFDTSRYVWVTYYIKN